MMKEKSLFIKNRFFVKQLTVVGIWSIVILLFISSFTFPSGCAKESKELIVGAILTLSGNAAQYGISAKNSLEMGIKEINKSNLLKGRKLSVIYEDDLLDPKTGVAAFRKLVDINKVSVVIGPLTSSVALAIAPVANGEKVVLLSPSASSPSLTDAGDYIFRNVASDEFEARVMAQYASDSLRLIRIGILYINNDFGLGYKEFFTKFFSDKGGEIPVTEVYEQGASDFRTQITKIKATEVDAIYLIGYREMGIVLRQAQELGVKAQFLSYSAIEDPDILTQALDAANGLVYTRQSFDPDDPENVVKQFSSSYREKYGRDPDAYAALAYDTIKILAKAIANSDATSDGIKNALYKIKDFPGVTGRTSFDENGDVTKSISIKKIENRNFNYIVKSYFKP